MLMLPSLRPAHFGWSSICRQNVWPKSFHFCDNFWEKSYPNPEIPFTHAIFLSFSLTLMAIILPNCEATSLPWPKLFMKCQISDNLNIFCNHEMVPNVQYIDPRKLQPGHFKFLCAHNWYISISQIRDLLSHYNFICCQILPSATLTSLQKLYRLGHLNSDIVVPKNLAKCYYALTIKLFSFSKRRL